MKLYNLFKGVMMVGVVLAMACMSSCTSTDEKSSVPTDAPESVEQIDPMNDPSLGTVTDGDLPVNDGDTTENADIPE